MGTELPDTYEDDEVVTLNCGALTDIRMPSLGDSHEAILDVVALPTKRAFGLPPNGRGMKSGLAIRPGAQFDLIIPRELRGRATVKWGGGPTTHLRVDGCTAASGPSYIRDVLTAGSTPPAWLAFAGGYSVDVPMCLPLIVKTSAATQTVHIGLGVTCPGQEPPRPGPQDSNGDPSMCQTSTSVVDGKHLSLSYDGRVGLYDYDSPVGMHVADGGRSTKVLWMLKTPPGSWVSLRAVEVTTGEVLRWETGENSTETFKAPTIPGLPFAPSSSASEDQFRAGWSTLPSGIEVERSGTVAVTIGFPDGLSTMCVRFVARGAG